MTDSVRVIAIVDDKFISNLTELQEKYTIIHVSVIGKDTQTDGVIVTLNVTAENLERLKKDGHLRVTEKSTTLSTHSSSGLY